LGGVRGRESAFVLLGLSAEDQKTEAGNQQQRQNDPAERLVVELQPGHREYRNLGELKST
jgi:hypothetical protein